MADEVERHSRTNDHESCVRYMLALTPNSVVRPGSEPGCKRPSIYLAAPFDYGLLVLELSVADLDSVREKFEGCIQRLDDSNVEYIKVTLESVYSLHRPFLYVYLAFVGLILRDN